MIKKVFISLIVILTGCHQTKTDKNETHEIRNTINGRYDDKSGYSLLSLRLKVDSLLGTHCFVTHNGGKIDCCTGTQFVTLKLKYQKPNSYEGTMLSCYDDELHMIKITEYSDSIEFIFIRSDHPFLGGDTLHFYKIKTDLE